MAKSKFFRVAVEGATTDGRVMERSWIQEIASQYNTATYGARIFMEHIRGIVPDSPFKAYGDVTAVKAEEITDGDLKGKLALFAQIDPTPAMVALVKAKQKIYTSIEVNPKFSSTGKAYLMGLGITDSPASLGTEMLTFASQHPDANPLASRKHSPDCLFSAAAEVELEWEAESDEKSASQLFKKVRETLDKIAGRSKSHDGQFAELESVLDTMAQTLDGVVNRDTAVTKQFSDSLDKLVMRLDAMESSATQLGTDFAALRISLDKTPATPERQKISGGGTAIQTDF